MMKIFLVIIAMSILLINCGDRSSTLNSNIYLVAEIPENTPIVFKPELVPYNMLLHSGVFSPDLEEFYFTISDKNYNHFDVKAISKIDGKWSEPKDAFFNSEYNEHGMNYSPDGKFLYFSSTRPANIDGVPETWHIWRSEKTGSSWSEPEFLDIPNMREKLVSHPSVTENGTIYFHAGNSDYSGLDIYSSKPVNGKYQNAIKLSKSINSGITECTPFISPDGSYLLFERSPDIYISFKSENNDWSAAQPLNKKINTDGKGNPFITPDGKYMFYARGKNPVPDEIANWSIYWVSTDSILIK